MKGIPSPCFVLEESKLIRNLELMQSVKERAGISIILALKGFAMWKVFPTIQRYLDGATASSLHEAMLCNEEMKSKAHTYCAAYVPEEFDQISDISSHISFNSLNEYHKYKEICHKKGLKCAIRVNPEYSDVGTALYNPCAPGSRLGETYEHFAEGLPEGITGLHFHALCESNSYDLERTLNSFEKHFGHLLDQIEWINMGGGHLMTKAGYDIEHLISILKNFQVKHKVKIILEPGACAVWQTGYLTSRVLDIVNHHGIKTAMLDISFTAHMPDTLEMPYRPTIREGSAEDSALPYAYRLGGMSCLSGDFLENYFFEKELQIGDSITFEDMIHYTMVKTTTFNGVNHPSIGIVRSSGEFEIIRKFGYDDFKNRLS